MLWLLKSVMEHPCTLEWNLLIVKCKGPKKITILTCITFFTALPFVSQRADAAAISARAVTTACGVNALADGNVTFRPFPSTVAEAGSLAVLAIATAQDWAGS